MGKAAANQRRLVNRTVTYRAFFLFANHTLYQLMVGSFLVDHSF